MKLLAEITTKSLGLGEESERLRGTYELRKSARVILECEVGMIAIQHLTEFGIYKLPGGGMENAETVMETAIREIREEVGAQIEVIDAVGMIIEYRGNLLQISYCFHARVVGELSEPTFEPDELAAGQETIWVTPHEAIRLIAAVVPKKAGDHFIKARELRFLNAFMNDQGVKT